MSYLYYKPSSKILFTCFLFFISNYQKKIIVQNGIHIPVPGVSTYRLQGPISFCQEAQFREKPVWKSNVPNYENVMSRFVNDAQWFWMTEHDSSQALPSARIRKCERVLEFKEVFATNIGQCFSHNKLRVK